MVRPEKLLASATRLYGDQMDALWGPFLPTPEDAVHTLGGGERVVVAGRPLTVAYGLTDSPAGLAAWVPFGELTESQFREMMDVNVLGVFLTAKAVAPYMIERRSGSIVPGPSTSSTSAGRR